MTQFTESVIEEAALDWLRELGYTILSSQDLLPGENALRASYSEVLLPGALRSALVRVNPSLPAEAIDDALPQTHARGCTLAGGAQSCTYTGCWSMA
jgi:type I restriction enzyme R subunit